MALTWFELEVGYPTGPKAQALVAMLGQPHADVYPVRLWAYCYMQEISSFAGPAAAGILEGAAGWRGKRGALLEALVACGFVDQVGDRLEVHGVKRRLEEAWARRDSAAKRQRKHRDQAVSHADVTRDVTRDSRVSNAVSHAETDQTDQTDRPEAAQAAPLRPLHVHLQASCPGLYALLQQATFVDPGRQATLWGKAESLVAQVGAERALACWTEAAARRQGNPDDVPLAYVIKPLEELARRRAPPPAAPALPAPSPAWLEAHPGAQERWAAIEAEVRNVAYPDKLPELMARALRRFTDEVEGREVAA